MKRRFLSVLLGLTVLVNANAADIQRVEPPFWYAGMKNTELQIMLFGKDIANSQLCLNDYAGVNVKEICKVENPDYLFVYLNISEDAKPGTLTFSMKEGKKSSSFNYELRPRNKKVGAQGFTKADVLYLIMPDRFANGNPDNDVYEGSTVSRTGGGRHGGDLQGIREHLDYISDLGVTAIWLNPVQYNKGNASHGYAISDFYLVDPRLGSNEEYCQMIDDAHSKGIKVVMDMIFNHSGSSHWWMENLPTSDWYNQNEIARSMGEKSKADAAAKAKQKKSAAPKTMEQMVEEYRRQNSNNDGLVTTTHYKWVLMDPHAPQTEKDILTDGWFVRGMPDLNQRNRHLATYLIQNSIWWIEYSRIDGIRMDTYPYADYDFMARWCQELENEYPDFNIVGEGWYPRNSAAGWWQGNSAFNKTGNTHLKTVMDFDLTFTMANEFIKESNTSEGSEAGLFKVYEAVSQDFLIPDPDFVLTFLDNHDLARFMKEGDPIWKYKQGITFLLTSRGIPQMYYGTEIMMTGDNRADFPGGWAGDEKNAFTQSGRSAAQNEAWDYTSKLLNWRKTSKPITEGKLIHYTPDNQTKCYVYARTNGEETVLVILNGSDQERTVPMGRFSEVTKGFRSGKDVISGKTLDITENVTVEPRGAIVLELK